MSVVKIYSQTKPKKPEFHSNPTPVSRPSKRDIPLAQELEATRPGAACFCDGPDGLHCSCVYEGNQQLPRVLRRRQQSTTTNTVATARLEIDFDFETVPPPQSASQAIHVEFDVFNSHDPATSALQRRSTSLSKRSWWEDWLTVKLESEKSAEMIVNIKQPLLALSATCQNGGALGQANMDVGLTGYARYYLQFGFRFKAVIGNWNIDDARIYLRGSGDVLLTLSLEASLYFGYDSGLKELAAIYLSPYKVEGLFAIGPKMELHAQLKGHIKLDAHIELSSAITLPSFQVGYEYKQDPSAGKLNELAEPTSGLAQTTLTAGASVEGNIEVNVVWVEEDLTYNGYPTIMTKY
ncbi:hypothetical protein HK097_000002 [Rhizophlyctis rosea]|uniref:Uncharacterized protein n=1 Tax=Rhizophlyctis rosea TaxID=64517 RepID=A0AAD5SL39_9FUNG|nr:hypothetical protein HK097_000002 [Rhizophlyctis rosea]